jgi:hydroxyacylglutathione hydrolase
MPEPATKLEIRRFTLGPFQTNCYLVRPEGSPTGWVVDASFEPGTMIATIRAAGWTPEALILTHAHVDHIAGVGEVRRAFPNLPILIHEAERDWLTDPVLNLSGLSGMAVTAPSATRLLTGGDTLSLGATSWRVLHTPGHSPGSITLYNAESAVALVGDALFAGSVGRTDFPGSDPDELARSIRERLYTLPAETKVLPGHGPTTTIGREAASNPFVRA